MEIASTAGSILSDSSDHKDSASVVTSSFLSESAAVTTNSVSNEPSMNLLTVRNQNGQFIIQQPLKMMTGSSALLPNGVTLGKGHIIVKQKPLSNLQPAPTLESNSVTLDTSNLGNIGMKRPLTSSGNNVITKVIITKNPLSGQAQAFPVGSSSQTIALTSPASSSHIKTGSQVTQMAATLTKAPGGATSPIKTVIATGMPYYKIPTSPVKTPTKITMIPVSGSPNKQSISSNITVLSHALQAAAQSGTVPIRPGTTSKVIIKQGPAVGSSVRTV